MFILAASTGWEAHRRRTAVFISRENSVYMNASFVHMEYAGILNNKVVWMIIERSNKK